MGPNVGVWTSPLDYRKSAAGWRNSHDLTFVSGEFLRFILAFCAWISSDEQRQAAGDSRFLHLDCGVACLKGEQKVRQPWWAPSCLSVVFAKAAKRNRQSRVVSLKLEP
nr:uncharacterized LOC103502119 [Ipomoea batatas]